MINLSKLELFWSFTDGELQEFSQIIRELELSAGDMLFEEGDPGDALFIISDGSVRIFKAIGTAEGEKSEKSLALLEAGSYIGEMTLMEGTPRTASARVETDAIILKISRDDFTALLKRVPQIAVRLFLSFMKVVSDRLRNTNQELVVLFEVGKLISNSPPLADLLSGILKILAGGMKVENGIVFILNEYSGRVEVQEALGPIAGKVFGLKFNPNEGVVGLAMSQNKVLNVKDMEADCPGVKKFGFERNLMLVVPLVMKGKTFGAVLLAGPVNSEPFSNASINLVTAVASQAGAAIEAALLNKDKTAREHFERKSIQF